MKYIIQVYKGEINGHGEKESLDVLYFVVIILNIIIL